MDIRNKSNTQTVPPLTQIVNANIDTAIVNA
jgi:hypothetical protein